MNDPSLVGADSRLSLIEKLRQWANTSRSQSDAKTLAEAADALEAQQEALQPFATVATQLSKGCPDSYVMVPWTDLTAKTFRAAAKVLLPEASSKHARSTP